MTNDHPFFFEALNVLGEPVKGTISGSGEEDVRRKLETDFGYRVKSVHEDAPVIFAMPSVEPLKKEEGIIFQGSGSSGGQQERSGIKEDELQAMHDQVDTFLKKHEKVLAAGTIVKLHHVQGKLPLLRQFPSRQRLWSLKWQLFKSMRQAKREVKAYEEQQWKAYDQGFEQGQEGLAPVDGGPSAQLWKPRWELPESIKNAFAWVKVFDTPDPNLEDQVLKKQYYESVWIELYRFTSMLFGFYLFCFLIAYYSKRLGYSEAFIVRIYDAVLFKQIVLFLFSLFAVLSIRMAYLKPRLVSDAVLVIVFLASVGWIWG